MRNILITNLLDNLWNQGRPFSRKNIFEMFHLSLYHCTASVTTEESWKVGHYKKRSKDGKLSLKGIFVQTKEFLKTES